MGSHAHRCNWNVEFLYKDQYGAVNQRAFYCINGRFLSKEVYDGVQVRHDHVAYRPDVRISKILFQ